MIKRSFIFVLFVLAVAGCRIEEDTPQIEIDQSSAAFVQPDQIPDIINRLGENLSFEPDAIFSSNGGNTNSIIGEILMDQIIQVVDSIGNANYSFGLDDGDNNPYTILNLVVNQTTGGFINEPYLLYYELDTAFIQQYEASGRSFENFTGRITKKYISGLTEGNSGGFGAALEGQGYTFPQLIPTDPCDEVNDFQDGVSTVGGSGGGTSDGADGDSGSDPDTDSGYITTIRTCEVEYITYMACPASFTGRQDCPWSTRVEVGTWALVCTNTVVENNANDGSGCDDGGEVGIVLSELDRRLSTLEELVLQDSTKLINIPCKELENWKPIGGFKPPKVVSDKIKRLARNYPNLKALFTGDFSIQQIEKAYGTVVNMDFFSVKVDRLPNGMNAEGLLRKIRLDFNSFINTEYGEFSPYDFVDTGVDESALWNSNNPVGAILHIEIPKDEGSVICSDYSPEQWKFTTISAPYDWDHPVTGTREFGFSREEDGSYTFYTRGVDRISEALNQLIGERKTFNGADNLWKSFQEGLEEFVLINGGTASKQIPIVGRPDWDEVVNYLTGNASIESIGCKN